MYVRPQHKIVQVDLTEAKQTVHSSGTAYTNLYI